MKTYQWSCCDVIDAPAFPDYDGEIVRFEGLMTPPTQAETRGEALSKLHDWFVANKCRPYREVM